MPDAAVNAANLVQQNSPLLLSHLHKLPMALFQHFVQPDQVDSHVVQDLMGHVPRLAVLLAVPL